MRAEFCSSCSDDPFDDYYYLWIKYSFLFRVITFLADPARNQYGHFDPM